MTKTSVHSQEYEGLRVWLRERREALGYSLRELAAKVGCHHSILGKIERGGRRLELIEFIEIAEQLGLDPHEGLEILIRANR